MRTVEAIAWYQEVVPVGTVVCCDLNQLEISYNLKALSISSDHLSNLLLHNIVIYIEFWDPAKAGPLRNAKRTSGLSFAFSSTFGHRAKGVARFEFWSCSKDRPCQFISQTCFNRYPSLVSQTTFRGHGRRISGWLSSMRQRAPVWFDNSRRSRLRRNGLSNRGKVVASSRSSRVILVRSKSSRSRVLTKGMTWKNWDRTIGSSPKTFFKDRDLMDRLPFNPVSKSFRFSFLEACARQNGL